MSHQRIVLTPEARPNGATTGGSGVQQMATVESDGSIQKCDQQGYKRGISSPGACGTSKRVHMQFVQAAIADKPR